ncbi:hypothetical protein F6X40_23845 [Paraburkholderia sp. UCT31]|uniref:glyoxalase superfamily protein n=1 Tax=Paraburkholderia sp. UCT31 TaxID=2615209 RepID=UPI00165601F1|nr:glyoxalase superfamily protein [Paraburkholderia sp. UCT31]MBC8739750.1 hypothetical protein [Paraburkholderia sp. UCT31]
MSNNQEMKAAARRVADHLAGQGIRLNHSRSLEVVAHARGDSCWNTAHGRKTTQSREVQFDFLPQDCEVSNLLSAAAEALKFIPENTPERATLVERLKSFEEWCAPYTFGVDHLKNMREDEIEGELPREIVSSVFHQFVGGYEGCSEDSDVLRDLLMKATGQPDEGEDEDEPLGG